MRIGAVLGHVTLTRTYPTLKSGRFLITRPIDRRHLRQGKIPEDGETIIVYDNLAATTGCTIGFSEGREASAPFGKTKTPVDAFNACILDDVTITYG